MQVNPLNQELDRFQITRETLIMLVVERVDDVQTTVPADLESRRRDGFLLMKRPRGPKPEQVPDPPVPKSGSARSELRSEILTACADPVAGRAEPVHDGTMVTRKSPRVWISLVAAGLAAGTLGVTFIMIGLEQADQLASAVGVFVGLAGLGVSAYGVMLTHRRDSPNPSPSPAPAPAGPRNAVTACGERSVRVRYNSGVIQTGDDSIAHR